MSQFNNAVFLYKMHDDKMMMTIYAYIYLVIIHLLILSTHVLSPPAHNSIKIFKRNTEDNTLQRDLSALLQRQHSHIQLVIGLFPAHCVSKAVQSKLHE